MTINDNDNADNNNNNNNDDNDDNSNDDDDDDDDYVYDDNNNSEYLHRITRQYMSTFVKRGLLKRKKVKYKLYNNIKNKK